VETLRCSEGASAVPLGEDVKSRGARPASSKSGSERCGNEGQAEPEHPAPTLALTAASDETGGSDTAQTTPAASESDSGTSGLAVTALIVGIVGLLAGVTLALGARRHAATPATRQGRHTAGV
jgi:hypothetical protein